MADYNVPILDKISWQQPVKDKDLSSPPGSEASGARGTITHFALFDGETGGNMLAHGTVNVEKSFTTGDSPKFNIGDLDITLD